MLLNPLILVNLSRDQADITNYVQIDHRSLKITNVEMKKPTLKDASSFCYPESSPTSIDP